MLQYYANGVVRAKYWRYFCSETEKNVIKAGFDDWVPNGWKNQITSLKINYTSGCQAGKLFNGCGW
jgi:hypothetical protein